jgi:hypothetical protein
VLAKRSLVAANFSRLSTAISCVSLSISACLKAISRVRDQRSLALTCAISDSIACRICGSRASSCCALIMDSHRA